MIDCREGYKFSGKINCRNIVFTWKKASGLESYRNFAKLYLLSVVSILLKYCRVSFLLHCVPTKFYFDIPAGTTINK